MTTPTITPIRLPEAKQQTQDKDEDKLAHYAIGGYEAVIEALANGTMLVALCGYKWKPRGLGGPQMDICAICAEIEKNLPNNQNPSSDDDDYDIPRRYRG